MKYRHKKRGTEYEVLTMSARLQISGNVEDNEVMVVYRGDDGQVWVRAEYEFMDGRFERIPALTKNSDEAWQCAARKQGTAGGNDPADCDWPFCGCDPRADKVLEAVEERSPALTNTSGDDEALAWWHKIVEMSGWKGGLLSKSPENPWSQWLEEHKDECEYSCTPLYARPQSAAVRDEADIFERLRNAYLRGAKWRDENGSLELVMKAASDYADYQTSPLRETQEG